MIFRTCKINSRIFPLDLLFSVKFSIESMFYLIHEFQKVYKQNTTLNITAVISPFRFMYPSCSDEVTSMPWIKKRTTHEIWCMCFISFSSFSSFSYSFFSCDYESAQFFASCVTQYSKCHEHLPIFTSVYMSSCGAHLYDKGQ